MDRMKTIVLVLALESMVVSGQQDAVVASRQLKKDDDKKCFDKYEDICGDIEQYDSCIDLLKADCTLFGDLGKDYFEASFTQESFDTMFEDLDQMFKDWEDFFGEADYSDLDFGWDFDLEDFDTWGFDPKDLGYDLEEEDIESILNWTTEDLEKCLQSSDFQSLEDCMNEFWNDDVPELVIEPPPITIQTIAVACVILVVVLTIIGCLIYCCCCLKKKSKGNATETNAKTTTAKPATTIQMQQPVPMPIPGQPTTLMPIPGQSVTSQPMSNMMDPQNNQQQMAFPNPPQGMAPQMPQQSMQPVMVNPESNEKGVTRHTDIVIGAPI